jgi:phage terminase large subunit-like protein
MSAALERLRTDVATGGLTHDGDPTVAAHLRNARAVRRPGGVVIGKPNVHQKIDLIMADCLAHEAAADAIAAGLTKQRRRGVVIW